MASSRKPAAADLIDSVWQFLSSAYPPGPSRRFCVGYSGGLDSTVLLHILRTLRDTRGTDNFELSALHVHHGLSPNADVWAAHCRQTCAHWEIPLQIEQVTVRTTEQGLEAAARTARYAAFARADGDALLLAHHRDDQVETLFHRLLRGTGLRGLAGMPAQRSLSPSDAPRQLALLRPLLSWGRSDLEHYALQAGLPFITDESNTDTALTRNWLRHEILPAVEQRFPGCRQTLSRTSQHLYEASALLNEYGQQDLAGLTDPKGLQLKGLVALSPGRQRLVLRLWLTAHDIALPDTARLEVLRQQMLSAQPDRHPRWTLADRTLHRDRDHLCVHWDEPRSLPGHSPLRQLPWQGESMLDCEPLGLSGTLHFQPCKGDGISAARLTGESVTIRPRQGGAQLKPDCKRPRRRLKALFQMAGVPTWTRDQHPMLYVNDTLAWVAGIGADCAFQAGPDEAGWLISWSPTPPGR